MWTRAEISLAGRNLAGRCGRGSFADWIYAGLCGRGPFAGWIYAGRCGRGQLRATNGQDLRTFCGKISLLRKVYIIKLWVKEFCLHSKAENTRFIMDNVDTMWT